MAPRKKKVSTLPDPEKILEFIRENPHASGKREIARAFGLNSEQKRQLKKMLRDMQEEGTLQKGRGRKFTEAGKLPSVSVLEVIGPDADGELLAKPLNWDENHAPPIIYMAPERSGQPALGKGDRTLAKCEESEDGTYQAKTIRRITNDAARVLGVIEVFGEETRIRPTDKRNKSDLIVRPEDLDGAKPGDIVRAEITQGRRAGLRQARVIEVLDTLEGDGSISLIALHHHDIPTEFPLPALDLAQNAKATILGKREDLRDVPLVTIDGADARDFDDAVWAEPDSDAGNKGGWHIMVAIADVASYVRPDDALDREARKRGNSVYFPDRVVPMLPEALSNGWCSLVPNEDRPCLAVEMWINAAGQLQRHRFLRGLMRSAARLTYTQVQAARDGFGDDTTASLVEHVIAPLYGAYTALADARAARNALELDLPEMRIELAKDGSVANIAERERLDSHRLIEEFMITANVAAAIALEKKQQPCMYRIHDQPSFEKLDALSQFLESINFKFSKGQVIKPIQFNQILKTAADTPESHMVSQIILRTQAQAEYNPNNIGHFGLGLPKYCHFTSPIRRYSDLLVHRALITGYRLGEGGLAADDDEFEALGEHISNTERRAAAAERDAVDRYVAKYLSTRVGATFQGRVNGVTRFGLFVTLNETGADGLVPIGTLPGDYYDLDEARHALVGRQSGTEFHLGQQVEVRLQEATPLTGGLIFGIMDSGGNIRKPMQRPKHSHSRPTRHKSKARGKARNKRR